MIGNFFWIHIFCDACQNNASTKINLVNNNNKNSFAILDYCFVTKKKGESSTSEHMGSN
jgi:hypothetical protein